MTAAGWRPRLVALDVDGTMVDGTNRMSDAVRESIHAVRATGAEVVIATGRGVPGVLDAVANAGLAEGYGVAANGAITFRHDPEVELLDVIRFDAREAVRRILERLPDVMIAVEDAGTGFRVNRPFPQEDIPGTYVVEDVESLIAEPATRVVIRSVDHTVEEFTALVDDLGLTGTNYFVGYSAWLDLAPDGVSKASGLELLCDRLGIARSDVLAVGDGLNDVEMLQWAGRGVAMGHAPSTLRDVADAVTGTIDEDGLAHELARYL